MTARLLDTGVDAYHADTVADTPTLNATVAKSLVLETPAHARQKHPRLGGYIPRHTDAIDEGTAIHQMLLGDDRCDILDFPDFRSNDARFARIESRAAGRTPILRHKWESLLELGAALKAQVTAFPIDPPLFRDGMAEQTIVWDEGPVTCRARLDWLRADYRCIDDLKKSRTAMPRRWEKQLWALGYDIQAAFYTRAVKAAFGVEPIFRFVAVEPDPPYAISVHVLSPQALAHAQDKVDMALDLWAQCLARDEWPAYPLVPNVIDLPAWMQPQEWDDTALEGVPF